MNTVQQQANSPVFVSDSAVSKVRDLAEQNGRHDLKLRVFVTGGGCSGFQYGFSFDEMQELEDAVIEKDGMSLLVDPMSYQYLVGATVDYQEGLQGAQFVVQNPNASSTCGCGSSFTI
ncbi:MAG: iron-sulfur cluster insertion protein ErpA [Pseudomonadota bacterium]